MRPATHAATPPESCCIDELIDMYAPRSRSSGSADESAKDDTIRPEIPMKSSTLRKTMYASVPCVRLVYQSIITMLTTVPITNVLYLPTESLRRPISGPETIAHAPLIM